MSREYRGSGATHEGHAEDYGYTFQARSPSDDGLFSDGYLVAGNVRLMLSGDIAFYDCRQVDRGEILGSLNRSGISLHAPYRH